MSECRHQWATMSLTPNLSVCESCGMMRVATAHWVNYYECAGRDPNPYTQTTPEGTEP